METYSSNHWLLEILKSEVMVFFSGGLWGLPQMEVLFRHLLFVVKKMAEHRCGPKTILG